MTNFLNARWENLIMANYTIDPKVLLTYLPNGVELDFYIGETYVSLVGFLFKNTRIFQIRIPGLGTFEEINLRFYVTRKEGNKVKRGVVFINETVPNKVVAFIANSLYNEHYTAVPIKHEWNINAENKNIKYQWKIDKKWNSISVINRNGGCKEYKQRSTTALCSFPTEFPSHYPETKKPPKAIAIKGFRGVPGAGIEPARSQ